VQSNELAAEQVLAWCNAFGDRDGLDAFVGDQAVDAPFTAVEGILSDLKGMELVFDIHLKKDDSVSKSIIGSETLSKERNEHTLNHPPPTPESVFASETFLR
jgi:hypothetical protein